VIERGALQSRKKLNLHGTAIKITGGLRLQPRFFEKKGQDRNFDPRPVLKYSTGALQLMWWKKGGAIACFGSDLASKKKSQNAEGSTLEKNLKPFGKKGGQDSTLH